jgi:hypothetical protein
MRDTFTIRPATDNDRTAVRRLALLDDRPAPRGDALLGFVDGELAAARPLSGGPTVADPFRRTADLVALMELRARQGLAA